jgi:tRNA dimethylallyltransferase
MKPKILIIAGPTASGKSALALELAKQFGGEIICADSLTIYRGLDIGSAKPTKEQQAQVPHHLLDIRNPDQGFTVADFIREAGTAIRDVISRNRPPIITGGTGLYIRALLGGLSEAPGEDLEIRQELQELASKNGPEALLEQLKEVDPATAAKLPPGNLVRIIRALEVYRKTGIPLSEHQARHSFSERAYDALQICLDLPREELYRRVELRVDQMFRDGLADEVSGLLAAGYSPELKPLSAIGYRETVEFLQHRCSLDEAIRLIKQNTRHYAKRQLTWFRREPEMLWIAYPEKSATITNHFKMHFEDGGKPHVQGPL